MRKLCIFLILFASLEFLLYDSIIAQDDDLKEGICAKIRLRIEQEAVMTKSAFKATLEIFNNAPYPITNIFTDLSIDDATGEESTYKFLISPNHNKNIQTIDSSGVINPSENAIIEWLIIPNKEAAINGPARYNISGILEYYDQDVLVSIPLLPAAIWVFPSAELDVHYFQEKYVYSDDPFTEDIIEPSTPFSLGLLINNVGKGNANNVRIFSSQPKIIDNERGLIIDFKIIDTQVGLEPVSPSLTVDFGDILAGKSAVARWRMTSTLSGEFTEYQAKVEHEDYLGEPQITSIDIHELIHVMRMDTPESDLLQDYLVNDVTSDNLPDIIYSSNGAVYPVNVASNILINELKNQLFSEISVESTVTDGWIYLKIDTPGKSYKLTRVIRSDGKEILLSDNAWVTNRVIRLNGQTPYQENLAHIVDYNSTGSYELYFENIEIVGPTPTPTITPTPTLTQTPLPKPAINIFDSASEKSVVIEWDMPNVLKDGEHFVDSHIYVTINDATETVFLGNTRNGYDTSFEWFKNNPLLHDSFREGPDFSQNYSYSFFSIIESIDDYNNSKMKHEGPFNTIARYKFSNQYEIEDVDYDDPENRSIVISWDINPNLFNGYIIDNYAVYVKSNTQNMLELLGYSGDSRTNYFIWDTKNKYVINKFKDGPQFYSIYLFYVKPIFTKDPQPEFGPYASETSIKVEPILIITDSIESYDDISGKVYIEDGSDKELILRWNFNENELDFENVQDYHIYVSENNENSYQYLGRPNIKENRKNGYVIWNKVSSSYISKEYINGPQFNKKYFFELYPMTKNGQIPYYGPYKANGSITYNEKSTDVKNWEIY